MSKRRPRVARIVVDGVDLPVDRVRITLPAVGEFGLRRFYVHCMNNARAAEAASPLAPE